MPVIYKQHLVLNLDLNIKQTQQQNQFFDYKQSVCSVCLITESTISVNCFDSCASTMASFTKRRHLIRFKKRLTA